MTKFFFLSLLIFFTTIKAFASSMSMIGEKGDPSKVDRTINIKMYDNYYEPNSIKVKKGETIKFIVKNLGEMVHEYNIATKEMHLKHQPEMLRLVESGILKIDKIDMVKMKEMSKKDHSLSHSHSNSVIVEPNDTKEIIWKFTQNTNLEMACNVPGHYQTGMIGKIILE
tara:strand:- start:1303 stop:1809 length:507 start_codon:yes stop_codon:yes gene_type:complete